MDTLILEIDQWLQKRNIEVIKANQKFNRVYKNTWRDQDDNNLVTHGISLVLQGLPYNLRSQILVSFARIESRSISFLILHHQTKEQIKTKV